MISAPSPPRELEMLMRLKAQLEGCLEIRELVKSYGEPYVVTI